MGPLRFGRLLDGTKVISKSVAYAIDDRPDASTATFGNIRGSVLRITGVIFLESIKTKLKEGAVRILEPTDGKPLEITITKTEDSSKGQKCYFEAMPPTD